ncbi:oligosaccharide flippase family protein [Flavobacteriaceae bacterium]|nr:oligosaccharide flippase family protein [Flavobacteriaceae bacterium]
MLINKAVIAFMGQFFYILIGLLGNSILSKLLGPTSIGKLGVVMVFITVSCIIVEGGFGGALIQKNNAESKDYSTVFIFNLIVGLFFSLLLFFSSGFIASFYSEPLLSEILKVLCVVPLLLSFQVSSNARLVREMRFRERALYKLISLTATTLIAITMAYNGFGIWSYVFLIVMTPFLHSLILFVRVKSFRKLVFCKKSFNKMFSFGVNTSAVSLVNSIFNNIYQLILGKKFDMLSVGFFYQAKGLQDASDTMFQVVFGNVFFSHLSKLQDKKEQFKIEYRNILLIVLYAISLAVSFVFIYAEEIVLIIYNKEWLGLVFYLRMLSISSFFYLQEVVNWNIFKIFNKTIIMLKIEIFKKIIQASTILLGIYMNSIEVLLYGFLFTSIISLIISYLVSHKIIDIITKKELYCFFKIFSTSILLNSAIFFTISYFSLESVAKLLFLPLFLFFIIISIKHVKKYIKIL